MNRKIFLVFIVFIFFSKNLFSQITINSSDIDTTIGYSQMFKWNDTIAVNLGSSGENQVWDFSSLNLSRTQKQTVVDKNSTPFGNTFPTSNYALKQISIEQQDTSYEFYRATSSQFLYTGFVDQYQTNFNIAKYSPEFSLVNFPLNYNQTWNSSSKIKIAPFYNPVLTMDSVVINVKVKFHTDGWGKLVNYAGADTLDVLRIRHNDTLYITAYRIGIVFHRDTIQTINYIYLTNNLGIICEVASLDGETNPNFTTAVSFRLYNGEPVGVNENAVSMTMTFSLEQNFPNPFNPTTDLSFVIRHSSFVSLKVYDVLGKEIAVVLNNVSMEVGEHQVPFDGSSLSSGIYFYRITTSDERGRKFSETKSMMLIK